MTERIGPLSNTLEASLRAEALEEAGVKTSMDGKGLWLDNWVHLESGSLCSRGDISRVTSGQSPLCSFPTNRIETTP